MIDDFKGTEPERKRVSMDDLRNGLPGASVNPDKADSTESPADTLPAPETEEPFRTPEEVSQTADTGKQRSRFGYIRGLNQPLELGPAAPKALLSPPKKILGFIPVPYLTKKQWVITA